MGLQSMIQAGVIEAQITAVHDIDPERAAGLAAATGAIAFGDLGTAVDSCDALWVCTPTASHFEAVREAATRGRAVFCEKPLATDLAGAEAMAQTVRTSGVLAQVGLVLRSTPVFRSLREVIEGGKLGGPMAAVFRDDQHYPVHGLYNSTWRREARVAGGGCLIEHSIHDLDILRYCLGEVTEVACRTSNLSKIGDVEDVASVSLSFASGASADLTSIWHGIASRGSTRRVEVFFERGLAWLDDDFLGPLHLETASGDETVDRASPEWTSDLPLPQGDIGLAIRMYVEADRGFADAVCSGRQPEPDFDEALVAHRLVDAAYRSAAMSGVTVSVP